MLLPKQTAVKKKTENNAHTFSITLSLLANIICMHMLSQTSGAYYVQYIRKTNTRPCPHSSLFNTGFYVSFLFGCSVSIASFISISPAAIHMQKMCVHSPSHLGHRQCLADMRQQRQTCNNGMAYWMMKRNDAV